MTPYPEKCVHSCAWALYLKFLIMCWCLLLFPNHPYFFILSIWDVCFTGCYIINAFHHSVPLLTHMMQRKIFDLLLHCSFFSPPPTNIPWDHLQWIFLFHQPSLPTYVSPLSFPHHSLPVWFSLLLSVSLLFLCILLSLWYGSCVAFRGLQSSPLNETPNYTAAVSKLQVLLILAIVLWSFQLLCSFTSALWSLAHCVKSAYLLSWCCISLSIDFCPLSWPASAACIWCSHASS